MAIVFSLGGSIFLDKKLVKQYAAYFEQLAKKEKVGVLVGGGKLCRDRIAEAQKKTKNEVVLHLVGIEATRENAREFCEMLENSNKTPAVNYEEALKYSETYPIIVMGGTIPYLTTDSNTVILAELLGAKKIINLTNVDYLYDKDPNEFNDAKKITKMPKDEFLQFVLKNDKRRPGEHFVVDSMAAFLLTKSKSSLYIINGKNVSEVKKAVEGKKFEGTVIE